jgi:hypothetical protein
MSGIGHSGHFGLHETSSAPRLKEDIPMGGLTLSAMCREKTLLPVSVSSSPRSLHSETTNKGCR